MIIIRRRRETTSETLTRAIEKLEKFWAEEKKKRRSQRGHYCHGPVSGENNDIDGWFRANKPQTIAECEDVRKALRKYARVGNYEGQYYFAKGTGRRIARVKGPAGNVLIVSPKARKYFHKKLCNHEIQLEVYLEQFGTEQPVFKHLKREND